MIRSFLAIAPPDALRDRLSDLADDLGEGRPTSWENLHLTVLFLGDRRPAELEDLASELDARRAEDFEVALDGAGAFGGSRPRSAHVRARRCAGLTRLHADARRAAAAAGFDLPRRRFSPHVTVARFSASARAGAGLARWLEAHAGVRPPPFRAGALRLIRSELTSAGPIYTEMMRFPLAAREGRDEPSETAPRP